MKILLGAFLTTSLGPIIFVDLCVAFINWNQSFFYPANWAIEGRVFACIWMAINIFIYLIALLSSYASYYE